MSRSLRIAPDGKVWRAEDIKPHRPECPMPRHPDGTPALSRPWPRWRVIRIRFGHWGAWGPTDDWGDAHPDDYTFYSHAEAIAWADQQARRGQ